MTTDLEYFGDNDSHGNHQFIKLTEIIDSIEMESMDNDSYIKHVARHNLIRYAKDAIRKLSTETQYDVKAFGITLPANLTITVPPDFVDYIRVSVVETDPVTGGLHLLPLDINYNINTSISYLQDSDAELLFDMDGGILQADSENAYSKPYKKYTLASLCSPSRKSSDLSKLSKNGEFVVDRRRGKLLFGSEFFDKEIVVEYTSDGLLDDDSEISVHKYLKTTIEDWIYYASIERKRNVPMNEKQRSLDRYKASAHKARKMLMDFKLIRLYNR